MKLLRGYFLSPALAVFSASALFVGVFSQSAYADTAVGRPTPEMILQKAAEGQNELRDSLFDIEINIPDMRDVQTFDSYFLLMDKLQSLAQQFNLDALYPDAVPKLAGRMVEKGVNWLDPLTSSKDTILYYHRWMTDPRAAFAFLDIVDLKLKREMQPEERKIVAERLTDLLQYAETRWPLETALRVSYRNTLSELAVQELRKSQVSEADVSFWLLHLYTEDAVSEVITVLLDQAYSLSSAGAESFQILDSRILALETKIQDPYFYASETLKSQLSEVTEQTIERGMRFGFNLSPANFKTALGLMLPHHVVALARAWPENGSPENAQLFLGELSNRDLVAEASKALNPDGSQIAQNAPAQVIPSETPVPLFTPPVPLKRPEPAPVEIARAETPVPALPKDIPIPKPRPPALPAQTHTKPEPTILKKKEISPLEDGGRTP